MEEEQKKINIAKPPKEIFEYKTLDRSHDIKNEGSPTFIAERFDFSNGINVYIKDAKYPLKGFVTPGAIWQCNIVKRVLVEMLKLPLWLFLTKKSRQKLVNSFNQIAEKAMKTCILEYKYQTPITQELYHLVKSLLISIGITCESADTFSKYATHLIQYDDAYRYRAEDIFSETSKEKLIKYPIIEIDRIMLILESRDNPVVAGKFRKIANLVSLILILPKYNLLFRDIISKSNFSKLQYDDADRYWVCMRNDYKFMGKEVEERRTMLDTTPKGYIVKTNK